MSIEYVPRIAGLASFGDYSPVSCAGNLVAVAGQFGTDAAGELPDPSPEGQVEHAFRNVGNALEAVQLTHRNVLKYTTYLVGRDLVEPFMTVRRRMFTKYYQDESQYPPNTLLLVAGLVEARFVVEIEALAVKQ